MAEAASAKAPTGWHGLDAPRPPELFLQLLKSLHELAMLRPDGTTASGLGLGAGGGAGRSDSRRCWKVSSILMTLA